MLQLLRGREQVRRPVAGQPMASDAVMLRALGKRVRELRKERGYSQEKLAELADIHENHVRRIEGGTANPELSGCLPARSRTRR